MRMCHPTEGNRQVCNPAFTFGLSHAAVRVLTLTDGPAAIPMAGPVAGAERAGAQPQQVWSAAGSRRLWAEAAP